MKKTILLMLGMAAMLASCSQDELEVAQGGGTAVITATVDDGIATRSTYDKDDVDITRCLLEVRDGEGNLVGGQHEMTEGADGTFTCTVRGLDPDTEYTYAFWADNGASYTATDLTNVTIAIPDLTNALAFSGTTTGKPGDVSATLTHAVAKVTLKTTGSLDAGDMAQMTITHPQTLNVLKNEVSGETPTAYGKDIEEDIPAEGDELMTIYVPAPAGGQTTDVRIDYIPKGGSIANSKTVTNVPIQANYRTLISGDIGNIGAMDVTATLSDEPWNDNEEQEFVPYEINLETAGTLTEAMIDRAIALNNGRIVIKGVMNSADATILMMYVTRSDEGQKVSVDMSEATCAEDFTIWPIGSTGGYKPILEHLVLPEGITRLQPGVFENFNGLKSVKLPLSLTTINKDAFTNAPLEGELVIPENVTFIEPRPFKGAMVTSLVWNPSIEIDIESLFLSNANLETVTVNGDIRAFVMAFSNESFPNLKSITFAGVTKVPSLTCEEAFQPSGLTADIYVPANLVEAFKTAEGWSEIAGQILPIE